MTENKDNIRPLIPVNPEGLDDIAEALLNQVPSAPDEEEDKNPQANIQRINDFWRISGVQYRNGIHTIDLAKTLLDNGASKTQDSWIEYSKAARTKGEFYTPDYPLLYGALKAAFNSKSNKPTEAEDIKNTIRDLARATLTRISYQPNGKDRIIHNKGMPDELVLQEDFVGPDEYAKNSTNPKPYKALLGTDNMQEITHVFNWLNGTDAYISRVNSRPQNVNERVARFFADSYGVVVYCYGDPRNSDFSLGVRKKI